MKTIFLYLLFSLTLLISCNEKQKGINTKKKNDFAEKGEALFNQGDSTKTSTALNNKKKIANTADKKPKRTAPESTVPSYDWAESVNKKNNLYLQAQKDLYLAATKLCETFDYQETFGYERSGYGNSLRKSPRGFTLKNTTPRAILRFSK